jgi:hypothetical protein
VISFYLADTDYDLIRVSTITLAYPGAAGYAAVPEWIVDFDLSERF